MSSNISLLDQKLLTEKFQMLSLEISEYSFANVYLFREIHQFELIGDESLFIKGLTRDGFSYLMPTFPITELKRELLKKYLQKVNFLFPIPEQAPAIPSPLQAFNQT